MHSVGVNRGYFQPILKAQPEDYPSHLSVNRRVWHVWFKARYLNSQSCPFCVFAGILAERLELRPNAHAMVCLAVRDESVPGKESSENRHSPELKNVLSPYVTALVVYSKNVEGGIVLKSRSALTGAAAWSGRGLCHLTH